MDGAHLTEQFLGLDLGHPQVVKAVYAKVFQIFEQHAVRGRL